MIFLKNSVDLRLKLPDLKVDIKQWMRSIELTACRAGLLICNDLGVALGMLQQEPAGGPTDLLPSDKMKDLIAFSVSEPYFALREALGIEIKVQ